MRLLLNIGNGRKVNLINVLKRGRLLLKSQMNLFSSSGSHHEGETVQGKHGQLIVKKNPSGHGGHLEYVNKQQEEKQMTIEKQPLVNQLRRNDGPLIKAKPISLETAYNTLSKKKNCKVVIEPKNVDPGMFENNDKVVEGILRTVNINSDGEMNLFVTTDEGEQIVKVPENQAIITGNNRILIEYVDREILIDMDNKRNTEIEGTDFSVIQDETELMPYLVADTVLANMMDVKSKEDETKFDEVVNKIVKAADQEYENNAQFKKKLSGYKGRDELEIFFEGQIKSLQKETPRSKDEVKNDNQLQMEIMRKAEIPEEEMADYALSSVADGKILRSYINEVKSGELTVDEAANRVKNDYEKMKSGEKEGKFIETEDVKSETRNGREKEKPSINKPKLILNYKKAV